MTETRPVLTIAGVHCRACGLVRYPPQAFGCERCGRHGEALQPTVLEARGRLTSWAVVRVDPRLPTPFTVAEVLLDAGSLIRALYEPGPVVPQHGALVEAYDRGTGDHLLFVPATAS